MRFRRFALACLAALVALTAAACASADTNSDQTAIIYDAGGFGENTTFKQCQGPNVNDYYDAGSKVYLYPRGQRTYEFNSESGNREQKDITVVSKDGVRMTVRGLLNFTLNTKCEVLRKFHENIGLKYNAGETGVKDWTDLLNKYLGTPLTSVMISTATDYNWRDLYTRQESRDAWLKAVIGALPDRVQELAEGDYFTGFTLEVPAVQPPDALLNQIQEQQVQAERLATINAQAAAQAAEIEQMRQLVELLGREGYILYRNQIQCEQNSGSCIPYLPIPAGGSVNVTPGG